MCVDAAGPPGALGSRSTSPIFTRVLARFGLGDRGRCWSTAAARRRRPERASRCEEASARAAVMLNVNGFIDGRGRARRVAAAARTWTSTRASARCGASSGCTTLRGPTTRIVTVGERIGPARLRDPDLRDRVDHDAAAGRARRSGPLQRRPGRGVHQRRRAGAARSRPIEFEGADLRAARARVPQASPSCRALVAAPFEIALDIDDAEPPTCELLRASGWGSPTRREVAARPVGLPRLRAGLQGRADGGEEHVRAEPQRLVQRSQHLLPRERAAGARPGDRLQPSTIPPGGGLLAFSTLGGGASRASSGSRADYGAARARRARAGGGALRLGPRARPAAGKAWGSLKSSDRPLCTGAGRAETVATLRNRHPRLNWGCGDYPEPGWINSDIKAGPGRRHRPATSATGCRSRPAASSTSSSIHALPEIPYPDLVPALRGAAPRAQARRASCASACPTSTRASAPTWTSDRDYFLIPDEDARSIGGKFITQMLWYGWSRTLFTHDFVAEMLKKAGFRERPAVLVPADQQPLPRDHGARQPRAREPVRRSDEVSECPPPPAESPLLPGLQAVHGRGPEGVGLLQPRPRLARHGSARPLHGGIGLGTR